MNETTNGGAVAPRCVGGLCVAIVRQKSGIGTVAAALVKAMDSIGAHTGILLAGSEFARSPFGPLPPEWLRRGIGLVVGESDDLVAEADTLFDEYNAGRAALKKSAHRAGETAKQPAAVAEPAGQRWTEPPGNQQYVTTVARPVPVAVQVSFRQEPTVPAMSDAMQHAAVGSAMGAGAMTGSVHGWGGQAGSMQGGGAGGPGSSSSGAASGTSSGEARGPNRKEGKT